MNLACKAWENDLDYSKRRDSLSMLDIGNALKCWYWLAEYALL